MALSRFWCFTLIASIGFVFIQLGSGNLYSLQQFVTGKQNDPIVAAEYSLATFKEEKPKLSETLIARPSETVTEAGAEYRLLEGNRIVITQGKQAADGALTICRNTIFEIWLPLIAYLTFFCGLLNLLQDTGAIAKLSHLLSPLFTHVFPELPKNHPAFGFMTMNFAANLLGLDSAATPFGLKAMESMQSVNSEKARASNSQIMFLCLHVAGLTLVPTSIIGYRASMHAVNPGDIILPMAITSFIGTVAALLIVGLMQKINLFKPILLIVLGGAAALIVSLSLYINRLTGFEKDYFTGNVSNAVLLAVIFIIVFYATLKEKTFSALQTNIFESFAHGARSGFTTGLHILPYMIGMLVALSLVRNSGLMDFILNGLSHLLQFFHVSREVIDSLPVAIMRPFTAAGSRGFMLDNMKVHGADSFTGRLSCIFQGASETIFYVIAVYYGAVKVHEIRYTLQVMLVIDAACLLAAISVGRIFF